MKYIILLWPHANARYRNEAHKLARAELSVILHRVAPGARTGEADLAGMPAIALESDSPLSEDCIAALRGHSLLYGLFAGGEDGALRPLAGRERTYLG